MREMILARASKQNKKIHPPPADTVVVAPINVRALFGARLRCFWVVWTAGQSVWSAPGATSWTRRYLSDTRRVRIKVSSSSSSSSSFSFFSHVWISFVLYIVHPPPLWFVFFRLWAQELAARPPLNVLPNYGALVESSIASGSKC